jgi:two-component system, OmpR family, phosphate regulon sensor histidine kinase PhoR
MTAIAIASLLLALVALTLAWKIRRTLRDTTRHHARELAEERSRSRIAIETESKRVAAIFDRMIDGLIIVGADGRIRIANRAAAALFEVTSPMIGRTPLEAIRRHEVASILHQLDQQPEVLDHEVRLERPGAARTVLINALVLSDANGTRDGALLVFHEVTRLRQLESVRQDFVANVSHELRTPLSLIKSAAETLVDGGKSDPAITDRFLDIIDKNANRLTLLIDDLLLLAKLDSGRLALQLRSVSLRTAAQEALDDAALIARARSVALRNDVAPNLIALADPDRLRQVLANLIDNAIKYGRVEGTVVVLARVLDSRYVELGVQDNGPGISPEAKSRVFERFYRVDKARAREQGGTGLGLAIVKNVVEAHGGDVRVESTAGRGTTFYFTLRITDKRDE